MHGYISKGAHSDLEVVLSSHRKPWRDIGIQFSVHLSVNICDHSSVDPTVKVCNSETLRDTVAKLGTNIKHYHTVAKLGTNIKHYQTLYTDT